MPGATLLRTVCFAGRLDSRDFVGEFTRYSIGVKPPRCDGFVLVEDEDL